jgi:hypothetical protein
MAKNKAEQRPKQTQPVAAIKIPVAAAQPAGRFAFFDNTGALLGSLVVATLVAFVGGFGNDFVRWDDNSYVTENPLVQHPTLANLVRLLRAECAFNYHPLTMASLWLNSALSGQAATSFIITNTMLHIVNTVLVFFLARKLAKGDQFIAFFTALLWGVHPMHTESVTWVSERKDVLYSLFFFASCIQYVKFTELGKRKFWISALLLFILSCLAKGMAVMLPLVLILIDHWCDKEPLSVKRLVQKVPFFIVALLFGLLAIHVQSGGDLGGLIERLSQTGESAIKAGLSIGQRICFGFTDSASTS